MFEFIITTPREGKLERIYDPASFQIVPRRGDFFALEDGEGIGWAYEVIAVVLPTRKCSTAGELIVRRLGQISDLLLDFAKGRRE